MRRYIWILALVILSALPVSAQESALDYEPLTIISREPIPSFYRPEYFAFSPDGTQIAAAATSETVSVWDIETGEVMLTLEDDSSAVSWSPDGAWIGTGNGEWDTRIWDAKTGELRYETDTGGWYIGFSPDSKRFVTNTGRVVDLSTGELLFELSFNYGETYEVEYSPDGTMIAKASGWEGSDTQLWTSEGEHLDSYLTGFSISWSPDSTRLASMGQIRRVESGLPEVIIPQMGRHVAWHPTEEWIASAYTDKIRLWDALTGQEMHTWMQSQCDLRGFAWSADGNRFAVACYGDMSKPPYRADLIIWERVR